MQGQELVVDNASEWNQIKGVHNEVIDLLVVLVFALLLEVEKAGHLPALMVAPQEEHRVRIVQLCYI